jgi:hypothetical protein
MKAIHINSELEFERLLDRVTLDAYRAADNWRLLRGLDASMAQYGGAFTQHRTFWGFVQNALHEVVLHRLGRLYDKTKGALSLPTLLLTAQAHPDYFSTQAFRQRRSDSPHHDGHLAGDRALNLAELKKEIASVSERDDLVKSIHDIRDKALAHRDKDRVLAGTLPSLNALNVSDVETLLGRASSIAFKYNRLYRGAYYSARIAGEEDYKDLLQIIQGKVDSDWSQAVDEEFRLAKVRVQSNHR